jgi:hypothetical protein
VIGPPGEFWRFLMQRFACEAHGAEQPWQALLAARCVQSSDEPCGSASSRMTCWPRIASSPAMCVASVVLPTPPFWLSNATIMARPSVLESRPGRAVSWVVHRNGALLLKVMYFLLGKLEGPQTRAVIGFAAFSYS